MPVPRILLGLAGPLLAAVCAMEPTAIGRQDVGVLAGTERAASWRAYLVAEPAELLFGAPADEEGFDALSGVRAPPRSALGQPFALALLTFRIDAPPVAPRRRQPFIDRTARSDRLAVSRGDMTPSMMAGMVTPVSVHGMAARAQTTPDGTVLASATPSSGDEPVAVASLPVQVQAPPPKTAASFRLASLRSDADAPEGVTSASRGDDEKGRSTTRLSHLLLLPESDLRAQQKCLAEAVYFEARGEPSRGQYAVAQVVMNRTRSGFYPNSICKVVYQNRHMFNACQFSFACDRWPDRIYGRSAWDNAVRIARDVTENGAWLPEVGGATHYHADYIRAWWAPKMIRIAKLGRHIFYRPRWLPDLGAEPAVSQARTAPAYAQDS